MNVAVDSPPPEAPPRGIFRQSFLQAIKGQVRSQSVPFQGEPPGLRHSSLLGFLSGSASGHVLSGGRQRGHNWRWIQFWMRHL